MFSRILVLIIQRSCSACLCFAAFVQILLCLVQGVLGCYRGPVSGFGFMAEGSWLRVWGLGIGAMARDGAGLRVYMALAVAILAKLLSGRKQQLWIYSFGMNLVK